MHVGVLTVEFLIPAAQSLKEKRMVLKSIKDQVRNKGNISQAELEHQDKWQRSVFGFGVIGGEKQHVQNALQSVLELLSSFHEIEVTQNQIQFL